jgi:peptidoglycan hydrolase-like protein with peptidoglycan-binding domain
MALAMRFARSPRLKQVVEANSPIKQGETGEGVRAVQLALIDLGYGLPLSTDRRAGPDGIFGPETAQVVARFQAVSGLAPDGIVGRATLNRLSDRIATATAIARQKLHLSVHRYARARSRLFG